MTTGLPRRWHVLLLAVPLCMSHFTCASGVRTSIHESPTNRVYLEWVPDESFRASHPATVSPAILRRVLTGLLVQHQTGIFDRLSSQEQRPQRVFSDEEVARLLPPLASALSRATPEERVVFQRRYPHALGSDSTEGRLFLREGLLFVTLTRYAGSPGRPDIRYVDNRQAPGVTGLADRTLRFVPEGAVQRTRSHPQAAEPILAIDYRLLGRLPDPSEKATAGARPPETAPSAPHRPDDSPQRPSGQRRVPALEERVNQQAEELDRLKRELRELQRKRAD